MSELLPSFGKILPFPAVMERGGDDAVSSCNETFGRNLTDITYLFCLQLKRILKRKLCT